MKTMRVLMLGVVLGATLVIAVAQFASVPTVAAQEKEQPGDTKMSPEQMEMMAAWQKLATPCEHHKHLSRMEGPWKTECTTHGCGMTGDEPTTSQGSAKSKMIMGGRFLVTKYRGEMMGQPFEGMSIDGYDNFKKKYVSMWIDNMGTGIYAMEGTCSPDAKQFDYAADWIDPMTGKNKAVRSTTRWINDDEFVMEMFEKPEGGEEAKMMQIKFTRS